MKKNTKFKHMVKVFDPHYKVLCILVSPLCIPCINECKQKHEHFCSRPTLHEAKECPALTDYPSQKETKGYN